MTQLIQPPCVSEVHQYMLGG